MSDEPFLYRFYDMGVQSDFRLMEADLCREGSAGAGMVDLRIVAADLAHLARPFSGFRDFALLPEGDLLSFRDVGRFLVRRGGSEIAVDLDPCFDPRLLALPLLGPVVAILLHRRCYLVLHGSAIELNGEAAVFLGDKGAGKSTTAASLVAMGASLIADDVVAVGLQDDVPVAIAGFQAMKLDASMQARFGIGAGYSVAPADGLFTAGKIRFRLNRDNPPSPLPLGRVHVLDRGGANDITRYSKAEALHALIRFSYFPRLGPETIDHGESAALFARAAGFAARLPVCRLTVRNDLDALPELATFLGVADRYDHAFA